jgi:two-component system cell cycle sensor histidine kinase/response regulator CckA
MAVPLHAPPRRRTEEARLRIIKLAESGSTSVLADAFRSMCRIAADTLGVERVGIWLFTPRRDAVRCACLYERSRAAYSDGVTLLVADFPDYFVALSQRKAIPAESATDDPRTIGLKASYLDPLGITSMLDAPVFLSGAVVGVVCHEHVGAPREWTTEERDFAGSVADFVAMKIKGAELTELWHRLRETEFGPAEAGARDSMPAPFSAGIAHDLRNLLTVCLGNAQLIASDPTVSPQVAERASFILTAAERAAALAGELTSINAPAGRPRVVCVGEAVAAFRPVLTSAVGPAHEITFSHRGEDAKVFVDPAHLERVILNLVLNARDATAEGGMIAVDVVGTGTARPGSVEITVRDEGTGIEPAVLRRVFEPFFTTKPKGRGSGLGLAIVKRIIDSAGGSVTVDSLPGRGTTVRVTLPRAGSVC